MTDTSPPPSLPLSGRLVRLFVAGLPLGLVLMGVLSFVIYFNKKNDKGPVTTSFASMLQRDLNTVEYLRYHKYFAEVLAPRQPGDRENLEAASIFIESSASYDNMGYRVNRQIAPPDKSTADTLWMELPGAFPRRGPVLVAASYQSTAANKPEEALGISALLCLAHSVAGHPMDKSVTFASGIDFTPGHDVFPGWISQLPREAGQGRWRAIVYITHGTNKDPQPLADFKQNGQTPLRFEIDASLPPDKILLRLEELKELVTQLASGS